MDKSRFEWCKSKRWRLIIHYWSRKRLGKRNKNKVHESSQNVYKATTHESDPLLCPLFFPITLFGLLPCVWPNSLLLC